MELRDKVLALAEDIHRERHGDTCADIHPVVHDEQVRGFRLAALERLVGIR